MALDHLATMLLDVKWSIAVYNLGKIIQNTILGKPGGYSLIQCALVFYPQNMPLKQCDNFSKHY